MWNWCAWKCNSQYCWTSQTECLKLLGLISLEATLIRQKNAHRLNWNRFRLRFLEYSISHIENQATRFPLTKIILLEPKAGFTTTFGRLGATTESRTPNVERRTHTRLGPARERQKAKTIFKWNDETLFIRVKWAHFKSWLETAFAFDFTSTFQLCQTHLISYLFCVVDLRATFFGVRALFLSTLGPPPLVTIDSLA